MHIQCNIICNHAALQQNTRTSQLILNCNSVPVNQHFSTACSTCSPQLLHPTRSYEINLSVLTLSGILWCLSFCICLVLPNNYSQLLRMIRFHSFMAKSYSFVYIHHIFFIHLSANTRLRLSPVCLGCCELSCNEHWNADVSLID